MAAAAAVVTAEAARDHIPVNGPADPNDAQVVVSGWPKAEQALITQNRAPVNSGVYLAPLAGQRHPARLHHRRRGCAEFRHHQ